MHYVLLKSASCKVYVAVKITSYSKGSGPLKSERERERKERESWQSI